MTDYSKPNSVAPPGTLAWLVTASGDFRQIWLEGEHADKMRTSGLFPGFTWTPLGEISPPIHPKD